MGQRFSSKRPSAIVTLTFNFVPGLPPNVVLAGTPQIVVKPCVRPGVSLPSILFGQAILNTQPLSFQVTNPDGTVSTVVIPPYCAVQQPVANGVPNIDYEFTATCGTTAPPLTLTCEGTLPVRE